MKKIILSILASLFIVCLTGCGEKSIKQLMWDRYDISSAKEISRESFITDDDCGEDSYISATVKDKMFNKINFHVYEYSDYDLEWCNSHYVDDFKDIILNKYFDSFDGKKNLNKEYKIRYILDNKYPLNEFKILGTFNNRKELELLLDEVILFEDYITKQKYNKFVVPYIFTKNGYFNYKIEGYGAEYYGYKEDIPNTKERKESLINEYLSEILQNSDVESMKDFTEEEIQQELSKKNYTLGIKENNSYIYYDKYMLNSYGEISMGTLYYFLQDISYNIEGSQYYYTLTINNHTLSCDINSNEICIIDGSVIEDMINEYNKGINIRILNNLLNLNMCAKHKNGYIIE